MKNLSFLPTTVEEMKKLGWERPDIILFSGDAYVDHPSFGVAVIGRVLEAQGYKVVIVPQPNWQDDLRDFKKFGEPRLFFGISPGAMDSMVNHYTAARRLRHDDAYTPGGKHGRRPDYPTVVYSKILKKLYPDTPVIAGGIEASMRRFSHYDYWQDRLLPSILADSKADMLIYGMGERSIVEIAKRIERGEKAQDIQDVPQTVVFLNNEPGNEDIVLSSYEECLADKRKQSDNFRLIEIESNKVEGRPLVQKTFGRWIKANPMYPPLSREALDRIYDLPYARLPHPRYKGKTIPAYEMIRHSVTMHRGCYGGCSFCTISAHQGKQISSRSEKSIINEVRKITEMEDFKGYISDLGGPSANMYGTGGKNRELCIKCTRPSCLHPHVCPNLQTDHKELTELYRKVDKVPGVKKSFVGSGVRYDLAMAKSDDEKISEHNKKFLEELIARHVSGRLKVAPEHTSTSVLNLMRKPDFKLFHEFNDIFKETNEKHGLNQQLIPYFISSHPGCTEADMARLAAETKEMNFRLEQVQDFTPTPMTLATEIYYSGYNPYTREKVFTARTPREKEAQRKYFFWYKPENREEIVRSLKTLHCEDVISKLYGKGSRYNYGNYSRELKRTPDTRHKKFATKSERTKRGKF